LKNESILFVPYVRLIFHKINSVFIQNLKNRSISAAPNQTTEFDYPILCLYRGKYEIRLDKIIVYDFIGIFRFKKQINKVYPIIVYPAIIPIQSLSISSDISSEVSRELTKSTDSTLISDIREYVYGDSYRKIHWKLSGKYDKLMVKNYQGTTDYNNIIMLDLTNYGIISDENIILEDKIIETLVSLAYYYVENHVGFELIYYDAFLNYITVNSMSDFNMVYRILTEIQFTQKVPFEDVIDNVSVNVVNKSNMILLTSALSYRIVGSVMNAQESDHKMSLFYISPDKVKDRMNPEIEELVSSLDEKRINIFMMDVDAKVSSVLQDEKQMDLDY